MMQKKELWETILSPTLCLLILCAIVALAVSAAYALTADRIAEQRDLALSRSMGRLIAAEQYELLFEEEGSTIYAAIAEHGGIEGHLILASAFGYSGDVVVLTAIADGLVLAVEIIDASGETPGLGQNIMSEAFTQQFQNLAASPTLVRTVPAEPGEIQALTGATISAEAVVRAVALAMELYDIHIGQEG